MIDTDSDVAPKECKETKERRVDLDAILAEIGECGWYQRRALALCLLVALLSGYSGNEYVFTAARIPTRCLIPECGDGSEWLPWWVPLAIPGAGAAFDGCRRFNASLPAPAPDGALGNTSCAADRFDRDVVEPCDEYVYQNMDTVVYEFELACQEWQRSLIGSASTFGKMLALPLTGMFADRFGRRRALALNAFNCAWLGAARYWAQNYASFIALEFLEAMFGAAGFSCGYTIVMEFMGPRYRVAAGATMSTFYSLGLIMQAIVAWAIPYWRHLTLALYVPQLATVIYFWIMPESVRWYLSKARYAEAEAQLKQAALVNGTKLRETSLQQLKENAEEEKKKLQWRKEQNIKDPWLVTLVFQHKPVLIRCIIAPVWWITTTLVYYGLSMNAVTMSGNKYINYIAVGAVEIPGYWTAVLLFDRIGRKPLLFCAFWICAACQIGFIFMSKSYYELSLCVYLVGKFSISIVATGIYVYTNELFPTQYRASLLSFSSMVGRIGAISAPLTPALGSMVWQHLPFVLFGSFAAASGLLLLLAPETRGAALPDTMQQAADLGTHTNKNKPTAHKITIKLYLGRVARTYDYRPIDGKYDAGNCYSIEPCQTLHTFRF